MASEDSEESYYEYNHTKKKQNIYEPDIVDDKEWEIIEIYHLMKDWSYEQAVHVMDKCDAYEFIQFIKKNTL